MKFRVFLQKFFYEKLKKKIMFVQIFQNRIPNRKNIVEREDTFQQYSEIFWNILITISISKYNTWCSYGIQLICRNYNESREIGFTFLSTVIYRVHFIWWNPQFPPPEILPRILAWIQFHLRMKVERFCLTNVSYPEVLLYFHDTLWK